MRELIPSILDGFDLDTPPELLTFTVVQPPAHGSLINSIHGMEAGADLLHRSLSVTSFTLQELRQGEAVTQTGSVKVKCEYILDYWCFIQMIIIQTL